MSACSTCTYLNSPDWVVCVVCGAANSVRIHIQQDAQVCQCRVDGETLTAHFEGCSLSNTGWQCPRCTFWQADLTNPRCAMCETSNYAPMVNLHENKSVSRPLALPREELPLPAPEEDDDLPPLDAPHDLEDDLQLFGESSKGRARIRFHNAVKEGQPLEVIKLLLAECHQQGVGCSASSELTSALKLALTHDGLEDTVLRVLQLKPFLLITEGDDLFFLAAQHGRVKVLSYALSGPHSALLTKRTSGETALQLAARMGKAGAVALLLRFIPSSVEQACWSALNNGLNSEGHEEVLRLLLEHDPELIRRVDFRGNTILHFVLGGDRQLFRPEFMSLVWRLHPPALHTTNMCGVTPFQRALWSDNEYALRTFQGELPLDEGMSFVTSQAFLDSHCALPLQTLPRELLDTVYHYLGFEHRKDKDK